MQAKVKKKKRIVKVRWILAAADGEVKCREAGRGGIAGCCGKYSTVNKRDFEN